MVGSYTGPPLMPCYPEEWKTLLAAQAFLVLFQANTKHSVLDNRGETLLLTHDALYRQTHFLVSSADRLNHSTVPQL